MTKFAFLLFYHHTEKVLSFSECMLGASGRSAASVCSFVAVELVLFFPPLLFYCIFFYFIMYSLFFCVYG